MTNKNLPFHYKEEGVQERCKKKGIEYGARTGQSLVGKYKRGIGKQFVVWHCKEAFKAGSKCVDGVCGMCKINYGDSDHSCGICNQKICDYRMQDDQRSMMRCRVEWKGPAPENCAICDIVL